MFRLQEFPSPENEDQRRSGGLVVLQDSAQSDQAMMVQNILDDKQSHLQKINALFSQLGADGSGAITYEMFLG